MNKKFGLVALSLLATAATAQEFITLKPSAKKGKDAFIFKMDDPSILVESVAPGKTNYGADDNLYYSTWTYHGDVGTRRALIEFEELNDISKKYIILNAQLILYGVNKDQWEGNSSNPSGRFDTKNNGILERVTEKWDESKVTWATQPATSRDGAVSLYNSTEEWNWNMALDVTDLVKNIVSKKHKNYGWMLRLDREIYYRQVRFATSDHADSTLHPELVITYTTSKEIAANYEKSRKLTAPATKDWQSGDPEKVEAPRKEMVTNAYDSPNAVDAAPYTNQGATMAPPPPVFDDAGYRQRENLVGKRDDEFDVSTSACNSNRNQLGNSRYYLVTNSSNNNFYRYGVEDVERNQILPVIYSSISQFNKNYYRLGFGTNYGIFDKDFKEVLPIEYSNINVVQGYDYFIATKNNTTKLLDKKGENVYTTEPYRSVETMTYYDESTNVGGIKYVKMYDSNGSFLFDLDKRKRVTPSTNGYYEYNRDIDMLIYRNNNGNIKDAYIMDMDLKVKDGKFEEIQEIKNGKAVAKNGKYGLIDKDGKPAIPFEYDAMQRVYSNLTAFVVKKNGKYGVINEQRKELIPMTCDSIIYYNENCIMVMQNKQWGMMDILGQEKVKPQFNSILLNQNYNNTTVLGMNTSGGKIVDVSGQTLSSLNIDKAYNPENGYGYYTTEKSGKFGALSTTFKELIPAKYESLAIAHYNAKVFIAKLNKKFGLLSLEGNELLKFDYDDIASTNSDVLIVKKGNKYGAFSLGSNKMVVPIEYDNIAPQSSYSDKKVY